MCPFALDIPRRTGGTLKAVHCTTGSSPSVAPLVILCHGFTGDKYEWGRFPRAAEALEEVGFDALFFDFSGSGENLREVITLSKQVQDLEDVYAWAQAQGYTDISTIGLSFGGLTALVATLPGRVAAVFWAPAFYMHKIFWPAKFRFTRFLMHLRKRPIRIRATESGPILADYSFVEDILHVNPDQHLANFATPALVVQGLGMRPRNPLTRGTLSRTCRMTTTTNWWKCRGQPTTSPASTWRNFSATRSFSCKNITKNTCKREKICQIFQLFWST